MKKTLLHILFFLVAVCGALSAQQPQTIKLTQLETAKVVESSRAGQIGLTNSDGKQRYAQYVEIDLTPIAFVPTATGNSANFSEFVTDPNGDKWYIDWQGRGYQFPGGGGTDKNGYYGGNGGNGGDDTIPSVTRATLTNQLTHYTAGSGLLGFVPVRIQSALSDTDDQDFFAITTTGDSLYFFKQDNAFKIYSSLHPLQVGSAATLDLIADSIKVVTVPAAFAGEKTIVTQSPGGYLTKIEGIGWAQLNGDVRDSIGSGGGIYGGSDSIPNLTRAALSYAGDFQITRSNGAAALSINHDNTQVVAGGSIKTASAYIDTSGAAKLTSFGGSSDDHQIGFDPAIGSGLQLMLSSTAPSPGQILVAGSDGLFHFANSDTVSGLNIYNGNGVIDDAVSRSVTLGNNASVSFTYTSGGAGVKIADGADSTGYAQIKSESGGEDITVIKGGVTIQTDYANNAVLLIKDVFGHQSIFQDKGKFEVVQGDSLTGFTSNLSLKPSNGAGFLSGSGAEGAWKIGVDQATSSGLFLQFSGAVPNTDELLIADGSGTFQYAAKLDVAPVQSLASTTEITVIPGLFGAYEFQLAQQGATNGQVLTYNSGTGDYEPETPGTGSPLSGLTAAIATNTIDNISFGQTWNWSTMTTGTPMTWGMSALTTGTGSLFTANALTTGNIAQFSTSNNGLNSSGGILTCLNNGTSTSGLLARFLANGSTAESGVTMLTNGNTGFGETTPTERVEIDGNLSLKTAGNKLKIATGANASMGTATLASGTVTVSTTAVTSSSMIIVMLDAPSGSPIGPIYHAPPGSIVNGTSFVINSISTLSALTTTDNSTVRWFIIN